MILNRIQRGASRSLLLAKHKLTSPSRRMPRLTWQSARNLLLNAMVIRAVVLPTTLLAPSSVQAATTDTVEPPSIVRISSTATDALTFSESTSLTIRTDALHTVAIGKSLDAEKQEQAAEQARLDAERQKAEAEEQARQAAIAEQQRQAAARQAALAAAPQYGGSCAALFDAIGMPESDRPYAEYIIDHEAGCGGVTTWNHAGSGAYGICQALPGYKMASAGEDWATNAATQARWCDGYAKGRYGSWQNAYYYWQTHHNW